MTHNPLTTDSKTGDTISSIRKERDEPTANVSNDVVTSKQATCLGNFFFFFLISKKTNILKEGKVPNSTQEVDERNQTNQEAKAQKLPTTQPS